MLSSALTLAYKHWIIIKNFSKLRSILLNYIYVMEIVLLELSFWSYTGNKIKSVNSSRENNHRNICLHFIFGLLLKKGTKSRSS